MKDDNYRDLQPWIEPELEARIAALVLGEASAFEEDELERMMEQQPELRVFRKRLEEVHGLLQDAVKPQDNNQWRLSPERREALLETLGVEPAGEEGVVTLAGSEAGRERRIRRQGLKVAMMAAACLMISLVLAPFFLSRAVKFSSAAEKQMGGESFYQRDGARAPSSAVALEERPPVGYAPADPGLADMPAVRGVELAKKQNSASESLRALRLNLERAEAPDEPEAPSVAISGGVFAARPDGDDYVGDVRERMAMRKRSAAAAKPVPPPKPAMTPDAVPESDPAGVPGALIGGIAGHEDNFHDGARDHGGGAGGGGQLPPVAAVVPIPVEEPAEEAEPEDAVAAWNYSRNGVAERELGRRESRVKEADERLAEGRKAGQEWGDEQGPVTDSAEPGKTAKTDNYRTDYDESRARLLTEVDRAWKVDAEKYVPATGAPAQGQGDKNKSGAATGLFPVAPATPAAPAAPGAGRGPADDPFAAPAENEEVAIPNNVGVGPASGMRSGDAVVTGNAIDAILNGPTGEVGVDKDVDGVLPVDQAAGDVLDGYAGKGTALGDDAEGSGEGAAFGNGTVLGRPVAGDSSGLQVDQSRGWAGQNGRGGNENDAEASDFFFSDLSIEGKDEAGNQDVGYTSRAKDVNGDRLGLSLGGEVADREGEVVERLQKQLAEVKEENKKVAESGKELVDWERVHALSDSVEELERLEEEQQELPDMEKRLEEAQPLPDDEAGVTAEQLKVVDQRRSRQEAEAEALNEIEKHTAEEPFSTFSLHVSDVGFKLAQAALSQGVFPEAGKVRVEEFVNAFDYGDPMPTQEERVACKVEQAAHPFMQQRNVMRIAMRTAAVGRAAGTPLRLTILLDNSGSMDRADRAESVQRAFGLLAAQLTEQDEVTLIGFARTPRLLRDGVKGDKARELLEVIAQTPSEGGTNLEEALRLGMEKALEDHLEGAQNRVILLTDGAANLGDAEPERLSQMIETLRQRGVAFDACGVGADGLNDEILEALTRKGDGRYYFLDRPEDADAGFARQIAGALRPAAKNVKVQVEFNPKRVGNYALYGFEKHELKKEDFRNDSVDAAELAAEEAGVALYHFEALPDGEGDVGTVSVRFQDTATGEMVEQLWPIPYEPNPNPVEKADPSMQLAATAAFLGEALKGSAVGDLVEFGELGRWSRGLQSVYPQNERIGQLVEMIEKVRELSGR